MGDRRPTVDACRIVLREAPLEDLPDLIARFSTDDRSGVRSLARRAERDLLAYRRERQRLDGLFTLQLQIHGRGAHVVAGVDEVGRGALAGPVSAAAVVLTPDTYLEGLDDSKRLTPRRREAIAAKIRSGAASYAVAHVGAGTIDLLGISEATRRAMRDAIAALDSRPDHVLVDGQDSLPDIVCTPVIKGDSSVAAIAAASILAKVERDALMVDLDSRYPGYGLGDHKGYGTQEHMEAISRLGPSAVHRLSFSPCRPDPTLF